MSFGVLFMAVVLCTLAVASAVDARSCTLTDAWNGKRIKAHEGQMFTDSCDKTYKVSRECRLQRVCIYSDACNSKRIVAAPSKPFIDSCGNKYIVESTCKLHRV